VKVSPTQRSAGADRAAGTPGVTVRLEDLHRTYNKDVRALDGLTLEMAPGELVALLGPSGCGKTTALRILAGLEDADGGRVVVGGRDVTRVPANKRDMGMVFQSYSLFPHLTARDNVAFGLRLRGVGASQRRKRAGEVLDLVGLSTQADRYAHQMSGGQQQRVALARALAVEPAVLLLDEPLSALDAKVRTQLREEIRRIQLEVGTTTLFVTHDQEEALAVADRVGVMRSGRLEQLAAPEDVYSRPATPFVAEFVGLTNRVPATVHDGTAQVLGTQVPLLPGSAGNGSAHVLLRPEALGVEAVADAGAAAGHPATVVAASFLGAVGRVRVATAEGLELVAQVASHQVEGLRPGDPVRVTVRRAPALAVAAA
jgi:putative spermidine/putrescine transport system ATP-binding protein